MPTFPLSAMNCRPLCESRSSYGHDSQCSTWTSEQKALRLLLSNFSELRRNQPALVVCFPRSLPPSSVPPVMRSPARVKNASVPWNSFLSATALRAASTTYADAASLVACYSRTSGGWASLLWRFSGAGG